MAKKELRVRGLCFSLAFGASALLSTLARPASAQVPPGQPTPGGAAAEELQREQRLRELDQLQLDTRLRANTAIPPGQRVLVDYGAFFQFNYLSLDDAAGNNHGLRQYDLFPYLRLNFDGAQEVFLRGRLGYRDFNQGDSFDLRGDQPVDGDLDRAYYRLDLKRYNAAYGSNVLGAKDDFNVVFQGGRDLVYWANGLVLAQTLDGIILDVQKGVLDLQILAGVTITRTVDFDTSRPDFDHNTRRGFFGGMLARSSATTSRSSTASCSATTTRTTGSPSASSTRSTTTTASTSASARPARSATTSATASKPSTRPATPSPTASRSARSAAFCPSIRPATRSTPSRPTCGWTTSSTTRTRPASAPS